MTNERKPILVAPEIHGLLGVLVARKKQRGQKATLYGEAEIAISLYEARETNKLLKSA